VAHDDKQRAGKIIASKDLAPEGRSWSAKSGWARETYNKGGSISVMMLPLFGTAEAVAVSFARQGVSVVLAGFNPEPVSDRRELSSAEVTYFKALHPRKLRAD